MGVDPKGLPSKMALLTGIEFTFNVPRPDACWLSAAVEGAWAAVGAGRCQGSEMGSSFAMSDVDLMLDRCLEEFDAVFMTLGPFWIEPRGEAGSKFSAGTIVPDSGIAAVGGLSVALVAT